jgi:hypothetical protein
LYFFYLKKIKYYFKRKTKDFVALKIVRSKDSYTEAARDEIKLLTKIRNADPSNENCVMHLLDFFNINGPYGLRLFFEYFLF